MAECLPVLVTMLKTLGEKTKYSKPQLLRSAVQLCDFFSNIEIFFLLTTPTVLLLCDILKWCIKRCKLEWKQIKSNWLTNSKTVILVSWWLKMLLKVIKEHWALHQIYSTLRKLGVRLNMRNQYVGLKKYCIQLKKDLRTCISVFKWLVGFGFFCTFLTWSQTS